MEGVHEGRRGGGRYGRDKVRYVGDAINRRFKMVKARVRLFVRVSVSSESTITQRVLCTKSTLYERTKACKELV